MEQDLLNRQKERASAFWKSYFAKFRRRVEDHEQSQTQAAGLSATPPLPFPDRRRPRSQREQRFTLHR
jgi:hypothetical protein